MRWKKITGRIKHIYECYDRFMEKQGFGLVVVLCVTIIGYSALYTFQIRPKQFSNQQESHASVEASMPQGQTLLEAQELVSSSQKAIPVPSESPFVFSVPVEGFLERDFSMLEPQYFAAANYYRVHPGIDLQAEYGTPVKACADGETVAVWQDPELGLCVRIKHEQGHEAVYAGLSDASYLKTGDPVACGQTIGHVGNGVLAENDAKPHLHLEVWRGATAVDPVQLFLGIVQ